MTVKRVDFDNYTTDYNTLLEKNTKFFSKNDTYFAEYKVSLMQKRLKKEVKTILEYGCGIGRNISFIERAFPQAKIVGTDISSASLDIARRDYPNVEFIVEGEDCGLEAFDLIFVAGVYHHIPIVEREIVSKKLFQRLAIQGDLFIFEHNPYNPITQRIVSNCPYDEDAVLLKPKELNNYLKHAGFQKTYTQYCLFFPPSLTMLTPLESRLGWLPLGGQYFLHVTK